MVKILHVHDQAGVACVLAKYQRKLGHEVEVAIRDGFDGYGVQKFYGVHPVTPKVPQLKQLSFLGKVVRYSFRQFTTLMFYVYILVYSRKFDVVHIHSCWVASFFVFKPKVVEFHGDDIRGFPSMKLKVDRVATDFFVEHWKGKIKFLVSTPDLLADLPEAELLPNPVDLDHFNRTASQNGKSVYFFNWHESDTSRVFHLAYEAQLFPLEGTLIMNRADDAFVEYSELPRFLSCFEFLIDREGIHSLSKTALEALAQGLKVVDWKDRVIDFFPEEHNPHMVANQTVSIYQEAMA